MQPSANNVDAFPLGRAPRGFVGIIDRIAANGANSALEHDELESRLLELGFVDGAPVEILHEGLIGGDPIAVRVQGITIALRRLEAMAVLVR
ncbi:MAG: ferrous iron transport protein A [Bradyrhizobium sp.]|uniref:FeoA family protein n=1 Tax=Bradyrhizobium sp. TaxID=376 RepID=UPI001EBA50A1|nr:FeoA family protein [Bradyrhizobium sp.]MBU6456254.1 FeoA domain-containing protein [Bradyrhizobium sp.]MDE2330543.1 ferrous iron transport protein A [Bradyrhizobium sp.]MDE2602497.1 ferrous iron transport protein A [Bradyrhizobium sp.]